MVVNVSLLRKGSGESRLSWVDGCGLWGMQKEVNRQQKKKVNMDLF